jgi:hypothetical protein
MVVDLLKLPSSVMSFTEGAVIVRSQQLLLEQNVGTLRVRVSAIPQGA